MIHTKLLRLVIIVILSVSLIVLFLSQTFFLTKKIPKIVSYVVPMRLQPQPCNYYCYSHPSDWENYLMKGNFTIGPYTNVIRLPDFFSCNYQLLELVTHIIELSKWKEAKPVVFLRGVKGDNLFLKKDLIPFGKLKDIDFSGYPLTHLNCKLHWKSDGTLIFACPQKIFVLEPANFKATISNNCQDNFYSSLCNMKKLIKGLDHIEHYCFPKNDGCDFVKCDKKSDYHKVCEEGEWHYPGGDTIECNNSITFDGDDIKVNYGNCKIPSGEVIGECNDKICTKNYYQCNIDFTKEDYELLGNGERKYWVDKYENTYYVVKEGNDISITYHNNEGETEYCTPFYSEGDCVIYCNKTLNKYDNLYDVHSLGYTISPLSNKFLYGDLYNYYVYFITLNKVGDYDLIVSPSSNVLVPRNKIVEVQKGLRNYDISLNPLAPVHIFGSQQPVKYNPWLIQGAVSYPRYFENATLMLYRCVSGVYCDNHGLLDFKHFCLVDKYLRDYPFVDCYDSRSFAQKLNISNFYFAFRKGTDIYNGFYCKGNYDACNVVDNYSYDDCRPAWETYLKGSGRCEDFALLYYTLFRTMGLSHSSNIGVSLNLSYCNLPCPCKVLSERCSNVNYTQINCIAPQYVTIAGISRESDCPVDIFPDRPGCTFNACPKTMRGINNYINGSIYNYDINGISFYVYQNFTQGPYSYPVYLSPNFNTGEMIFLTPQGVVKNDYCTNYPQYSTRKLITECSKFVDKDKRDSFIGNMTEACNI